MDKDINLEKREKIKKFLFGIMVIFTLWFIFRFEEVEKKLNNEGEEDKYNIIYDSNGFITQIINNGKIYKFERGKLL